MENKNLEPLLKEEEEKFSFLENKQNNKKGIKLSKDEIGTIIISVFVLWLMWYSLYPFYVGFKNFNAAHSDMVEVEQKEEEEIPTTSVIVNDAYALVDVTNNNSLKAIFPNIYSGVLVSSDNLDNNLKFALIFKYLGITCENTESIITLDKITETAETIFNDASFVQNISELNEQTIYGFNIRFVDEGYKITLNACSVSSDYTYKSINKVTTSEDYLYIYESFGYFVSTSENNYNVYDTALKQNVITTYSGNINEFNNVELLKEYKWTFKKSSTGKYYFVSINY